MRKIEKYYCDLCDEEFDTEEECEAHEAKHCTDWEKADNKKIAEELRWISDTAYDYRFDDTVLGYFLSDFEALMDEAAKRLEKENK